MGKSKNIEFQAEIKQLLDIVIHSLYSSKEIFFLLPNIEGLWNEDAFDEAASGRLLERVAAIPPWALKDWREAMRRVAAPDAGKSFSDTLIRIVEIDRLFGPEGFDSAASESLLARLRAMEPGDVERWARALDSERGQAALTLVLMDPLFDEKGLSRERFEKKARAMDR